MVEMAEVSDPRPERLTGDLYERGLLINLVLPGSTDQAHRENQPRSNL